MDEGKGGQTRSLQGREGSKQSANLWRNGKEKKKRDHPGQGGKKVTERLGRPEGA